ncbi:hypothetical protein [Myroides injenensis]|uniref:hypothetical protein n=1 Tax=Myroides injenensis TaxID=1183151 RepID=UPI0002882D21|nr:hypothetical protein [Myroides injenensis]
MSWSADQIYMKVNPEVITYLSDIADLKKGLFIVNHLDGIRSDWTRDVFFNDDNHKSSGVKHGLPDEGMLVINPSLYRTGYDTRNNEFYEKYALYTETKWDFVDELNIEPIVFSLDFSVQQCKLFGFLKFLNEKFNTPIVYYTCSMWAGDIEEEVAIVFDKGISIYYYDPEHEVYRELIETESKILTTTTALQKALSTLGLYLPTHFFALHETSFNWELYKI